jgi:hypothetical protein
VTGPELLADELERFLLGPVRLSAPPREGLPGQRRP